MNLQPTSFNKGQEEWQKEQGEEYFFAKAGIASADCTEMRKKRAKATNTPNGLIIRPFGK